MSSKIAFALLLATLLAVPLSAGRPATPPKGMTYYFLVLKEEDPGKDRPAKKIEMPDVSRHGGKVVLSRDKTHVILLPLAAAQHLRADANVAYLQRIWMGEPDDEWNETAPASGRLRVETQEAGDPNFDTGTYAYDGGGNIRQIGNDEYRYDSAGRLIRAVVNGQTETYRYDPFGNLTEKAVSGQPAVAVPIDSTTNRVSGATYDVVGNVVVPRKLTAYGTSSVNTAYLYDATGMMTYVENDLVRSRMIYTADDERIGVLYGETVDRWKIRDFQGRVLREFQGNGMTEGWWKWVEDYVYAESQLVAGQREEAYWGKRHFHLDHLGSVRMATSENRTILARHDYSPYGGEQTSMIQEKTTFGPQQRADPMKFTSHERDYLGYSNVENNDYLDYMHARYYNPNWGRFLSVDPGRDWDPKQPQSWNLYSYVRNRPTVATDPDGRRVQLIARELNSKLARSGTHTFIVVIPTGANQKQMASRIAPGYTGIVLGGYSGDKSRGEKAGTLVKRQNDPTDVKTATGTGLSQRASIEIQPPKGMTMEQFERAVVAAFDAYKNTRDYEASPEVSDSEGNCNTFSSGILVDAGVSTKNLPRNLPGVDWGWPDPQPIP